MNHTAHCYLSFANADLLLGNFIGDYVKGKSWNQYPPGIQNGILLHRTIDSFTDNHPVTRQSVNRIRPFAGRYAPPVVDILYDHLLCREWDHFSAVSFDEFAAWTYEKLDERQAEMPPGLQKNWPQMRAGRFLHGYQTREGLTWVLHQFARRLKRKIDPEALLTSFFEEIDLFTADFQSFFPDLQKAVGAQRGGH